MPRTYRASRASSQTFCFLYVYDGRQYVGSITERGDKAFVAYDADDRKLGTFKSMVEAARTIPTVAP